MYTTKNYRAELKRINKALAGELSLEYAGYGGRNGYTCCDRYLLNSDGSLTCEIMIEAGTPSDALRGAYRLSGEAKKLNKLTRQQAKQIAFIYCIDFSKDFYELYSDELDLLHKLAKASKYRRPSHPSGSTASYFFRHLRDKVKTTPHYATHLLNGEK